MKLKMEKGRAQFVFMVCLVLGFADGQSSDFIECYEPCFLACVGSFLPAAYCVAKCTRDCIAPSGLDTQYFCKLGCATSLCTNLTTKEDIAKEKVEGCVDSCAKNYCTKI